MKQKRTKASVKRIELDRDVVADLEASDADTDAVRGGAGYSRAISGGVNR